MTEVTALDIARQALLVGLQVAAPILLASLVAGTLISLLMAATQIQEFTLTFVPKLLAIGFVLLLTGPFMLRTMTAFSLWIFQRIAGVAP